MAQQRSACKYTGKRTVQYKWQGTTLASAYSYETAENFGTSYRPTAYRQPDNTSASYDKDYIRRRLTGSSGGSK